LFLSILGFLLQALGYLLLAILILFLALLFIPYHYRIAGEKYEQSLLEGSITWLFGGIKIDFSRAFPGRFRIHLTVFQWIQHTFEPKIPPGKSKKEGLPPIGKSEKDKYSKGVDHAAKSKSSHKGKGKKSSFKEFLRPDILKEALSTLVKLLKHFQPHTLSVSAKVGFNDPMMTGLLYGLLSQFHFLIYKHDLHVQPVFDEEVLEGKFLIGGRVWIPSLLFMILGFLLSKPVRSIYIPKLFKKPRKSKGGPQYVN